MESPKRVTGMVKWFNKKSGFGFITVCQDDQEPQSNKDIFVHYSSIQVPDSQYKYLVQGEYVDFEIYEIENGKHQYNAVHVTGVKGGNILCETRRLNTFAPKEPLDESRGESDGFEKVLKKPRLVHSSGRPAAATQSLKKKTYSSVSVNL